MRRSAKLSSEIDFLQSLNGFVATEQEVAEFIWYTSRGGIVAKGNRLIIAKRDWTIMLATLRCMIKEGLIARPELEADWGHDAYALRAIRMLLHGTTHSA